MPINARRASQDSSLKESGLFRIADLKPSFDGELDSPPAGRMLDSSSLFDDDEQPITLELELSPPPGSRQKPQVETVAGPLPAMWAKSGSGLQRVDEVPKAVDPRIGFLAFAGYGPAPEGLSGTPAYAFRVWRRRLTLRSDLKIARMRRLPQRDIDLYEGAIHCADEGAITKAILVMAGAVAGSVSAVAAAAALLF